jgi:hypothetical protein
VALESDKGWFEYVRSSLSNKKNAEIYLETDLDQMALLPASFGRVFDVVVIDGGDRAKCAASAVKVVSDDGLIIFDNSEGNWGPTGTFPVLDLLDEQGWMRADFYGYAPGVLSTSTTSLYFKNGQRFRHLAPPVRGGK